MTVQTPPRHDVDGGGPAPRGSFVLAAALWLATVVVTLLAALLVFAISEYEETWSPVSLLPALPVGLLLLGAVAATARAGGRPASLGWTLLVSMVAALVLFGSVSLLGLSRAQQTAGGACSAEEVAELEALSFFDQVDPPQGNAWEQCVIRLTVDATGQDAWVEMQQMLVDNGWQHGCEPDCPDDITSHYQVLTKDGFEMYVSDVTDEEPAGDENADGTTTTFRLDIVQSTRTTACSADETATLAEISDTMVVTAGYVGEPTAVVEGRDDGRCATGLGFVSDTDADRVLRESMDTLGWTLVEHEADRYGFGRGDGVEVQAEITVHENEDPGELPVEVTVWMQ